MDYDDGPLRQRRRINDDDDDDDRPDQFERDGDSSEGEGEDLFGDNIYDDYKEDTELDRYDEAALDFGDIDEGLDAADRRRIDEELDRKEELDREENARRRRSDDGDIVEDDDDERDDASEGNSEYGDNIDRELELEAFGDNTESAREWLARGRTRRAIKKRFIDFLKSYKNDNTNEIIYKPKIRHMCSENRASLEISYAHLAELQPILAIWLADHPRDMLEILDEGLIEVVKEQFENYDRIAKRLSVRVTDLPIVDRLRDLRHIHLNQLVKVEGVITKRTAVFPEMIAVVYDCNRCGRACEALKIENNETPSPPNLCSYCGDNEGIGNGSSGFRLNNRKSEYRNHQKITLQESHQHVPPGRVPRHKEIILTGDLIDCARPGEGVDVTGIYVHVERNLSKGNGFPVFGTIIEANCVQRTHDHLSNNITEDDQLNIRRLSQDPDIFKKIIKSIAPSLYGQEHAKTAIALSLFGGCSKDSGRTGHRVRGDINCLLLGDPGTAKSQLLNYAAAAAPRSERSTGKGASSAGLTASVHKDPLTKEWTLEGGALVKADQGVCVIDEFDKMNDQDRTSIHEAMEQQTISISKAGIVTSLQARCAVLAAANPIGGRYDSSYSFAENVELTDPILQRFDILCVLQDVVEESNDRKLSSFVLNSHIRDHPEVDYDTKLIINNENINNNYNNNNNNNNNNDNSSSSNDDDIEPLSQEMLRKYISYSRLNVKPVLHNVDSAKIQSLYADMRQQCAATGGVPIAVRHIESVMRIAESSARMHLRDHVRDDDVDRAIKVMLDSFIIAQKISVRKVLEKNFRKYIDFGVDYNQLIMHKLTKLMLDQSTIYAQTRSNSHELDIEVSIMALEERVNDLGIYNLNRFFMSNIFTKDYVVDFENNRIRRKRL